MDIRFTGTTPKVIADEMSKALEINDIKDVAIIQQVLSSLSGQEQHSELPRPLQDRVKAIHDYIRDENSSSTQAALPKDVKMRALAIVKDRVLNKANNLRLERRQREYTAVETRLKRGDEARDPSASAVSEEHEELGLTEDEQLQHYGDRHRIAIMKIDNVVEKAMEKWLRNWPNNEK